MTTNKGGSSVASSYWKPQSPEYVAVVLAGTVGTRLFPLTSYDTYRKHQLPVGGIPVLYRLLMSLQHAGFVQTVIVIADDEQQGNNSSSKQQQQKALSTALPDLRMKVQFVTTSIPQPSSSSNSGTIDNNNNDLDDGTTTTNSSGGSSVDALCQAYKMIPSDSNVMIVPGDLVILDIQPLKDLLYLHRQSQTTTTFSVKDHSTAVVVGATVLLTNVGAVDETGHPLKESAKSKKGLLCREKEEIDYIAISEEQSSSSISRDEAASSPSAARRLVWKQSKLDVEEDKDMVGSTPKLVLPKPRLRCSSGNRCVRVSTEWNDTHVYILAPWVRKLVLARTTTNNNTTSSSKRHYRPLVSLQNDLLPLLIARQYRGIAATFGSQVEKAVVDDVLQQVVGMSTNDSSITDYSSQPPPPTTLVAGESSSTPTTSFNAMNKRRSSSNVLEDGANVIEYQVLAHVAPNTLFRSHTISNYLYANKELAQTLSSSAATTDNSNSENTLLALPEGSSFKPKFHSIVLADCQIGDKVNFKSTVLGRNVVLGNKCRLNNVVVFDDVTIGDNVILQNTIVGKNVHIAENCNLNDCQVAAGMRLPAGTKKKGTALVPEEDVM